MLGLIDNVEGYQKIYNHAWRKYKSTTYILKNDETKYYLIE